MNICLIGDSLTTLALAKNLVNKKIKVSVYCKKNPKKESISRTIGISKDNLDFFNKEILKFRKNSAWNLNQIEIYRNQEQKDYKILSFQELNKTLFSMVRSDKIYNLLNASLKKNKLFNKSLIKNNKFYDDILKNKKYELIINCEKDNKISKKYFFKKFEKNYHSDAITTIIKHKQINNKKAIQIFTTLGPIAFLPISKSETSIVFSINNKKINLTEIEIKNLILKHNKKLEKIKFGKIEKFKLNFLSTRNYYHKNILLFGDSLHKIHPLAGQGFNMTLRDIKILSKIIKEKINLGLKLDYLVFEKFEQKTKHFNFIFSFGIDFIYEFFKFNNKYVNRYSNKVLIELGKNKFFNKFVCKIADKGLSI